MAEAMPYPVLCGSYLPVMLVIRLATLARCDEKAKARAAAPPIHRIEISYLSIWFRHDIVFRTEHWSGCRAALGWTGHAPSPHELRRSQQTGGLRANTRSLDCALSSRCEDEAPLGMTERKAAGVSGNRRLHTKAAPEERQMIARHVSTESASPMFPPRPSGATERTPAARANCRASLGRTAEGGCPHVYRVECPNVRKDGAPGGTRAFSPA
jgi:hypothetical protein